MSIFDTKLPLCKPRELTRTVDYFGHEVGAYKGECYIATDESGKVFVYNGKPSQSSDNWQPSGNECVYIGITLDLGDIDWRETLMCVSSSEPTLHNSFMIDVEYYGIKFTVPGNGYLATDSTGNVYWYSLRPVASDIVFESDGDVFVVALIELPGVDWRSTCFHVSEIKVEKNQ